MLLFTKIVFLTLLVCERQPVVTPRMRDLVHEIKFQVYTSSDCTETIDNIRKQIIKLEAEIERSKILSETLNSVTENVK